MDADEKTIKTELAEELGNLSEAILRREKPFDSLKVQPEVMHYYYIKYLQYYNELEIKLRKKILLSLVDYAKWELRDILIGTSLRFDSLYPQHMDTERLFENWLKEREGPRAKTILCSGPLTKVAKVNQIVKRIMNERNPQYSYVRGFDVSGMTMFSKPLFNKNKIYLAVDRGTKRDFLNFLIGLEKPKFLLDIACFFSKSQSQYKYSSSDEVEFVVKKGLDLVQIILPHFEDRIRWVLLKEKL